ncbi:MAG: GTPase Era [bacterium]|nr:GTPase Era [bacterium]
MENKEDKIFKSGFVSILGRPNVGKSTLLNNLIGYKISIVTHKQQTTRSRIAGVLTGTDFQAVFIDTPGINTGTLPLNRLLTKSAYSVLTEVDINLVLVDAAAVKESEHVIFNEVLKKKKPTMLVINKMDLVNKEQLFKQIENLSKNFKFDEIVPISALKGQNTDSLLKVIQKYLPEGPLYYPEDQISASPEEVIFAEFIREKVFILCHQEIPYSTAVMIDKMEEDDEIIRIYATILLERTSQKKIVIGKNGEQIKKIGIESRKEIERFTGKKTYIDLWIKIRKNWTKHPDRYIIDQG